MDNIQLGIALNEKQKCTTIKDIEKNINLKHNKYFCPNCKDEVIARIGKINTPHFSHKHCFCNPTEAQESGLHILCKEILNEEKTIVLPQIIITDDYAFIGEKLYNKYSDEDINYNLIKSFEYSKPIKLNFTNIKTECRINDIIPDIIIERTNNNLFIEIAVTHFIDGIKKEKIENNKYTVIEIDMSDFINKSFTKDEIKEHLIKNVDNKKWINFIYKDSIYRPKINHIKEHNISLIKKYEEQINFQIQKENRKRNIISNKFKELENKDSYDNIIRKYRNDNESLKLIKQLNFVDSKDFPPFLDIPIFGEIVFQCDRRIWQIDLFYKFIYNRKNNSTIQLSKMMNYIYKIQKLYKIDNILATKYCTINQGREKNYNLVRDVITEYFSNLSKLGFISKTGNTMNYYTEYAIRNKTLKIKNTPINDFNAYVCEQCGCLCERKEMSSFRTTEKAKITYGICKRCC